MENTQNNNLTIENRITILEQKIDFLVSEAKKAALMRKITIIITLLVVVLPIIIMMFTLPSIISSMTSMYQI